MKNIIISARFFFFLIPNSYAHETNKLGYWWGIAPPVEKEDEETRRIPIVFLTGVDTPSTVIECFDMDIQNYMRKPIKPKLLSAQIRAIFEEYQPA